VENDSARSRSTSRARGDRASNSSIDRATDAVRFIVVVVVVVVVVTSSSTPSAIAIENAEALVAPHVVVVIIAAIPCASLHAYQPRDRVKYIYNPARVRLCRPIDRATVARVVVCRPRRRAREPSIGNPSFRARPSARPIGTSHACMHVIDRVRASMDMPCHRSRASISLSRAASRVRLGCAGVLVPGHDSPRVPVRSCFQTPPIVRAPRARAHEGGGCGGCAPRRRSRAVGGDFGGNRDRWRGAFADAAARRIRTMGAM